MATFFIYPEPIGSQFTSTIGTNDDDDKNDFSVYIVASGNTTLEESDITLSAVNASNADVSDDVSLVSFEGSNASYKAVIRPMEVAGMITVAIGRNAVPEGNPAVSQTIRVSTRFPDVDAEVPTLLFEHGLGAGRRYGIAVSPTRILIISRTQLATSEFRLDKYLHNGTHRPDETNESIGFSNRIAGSIKIDYINGDLLFNGSSFHQYRRSALRIREENGKFRVVETYGLYDNITHTKLGITLFTGSSFIVYPYGETSSETIGVSPFLTPGAITHQNDLVYLLNNDNLSIVEIDTEDNINFIKAANVNRQGASDISIYRDMLYFVKSSGVFTLDIRKYRPLAKNTKATIYPVFANEGDTIPLDQYAPDAERIIWDTGFDKPDYLSINADNELIIANSAVSDLTPVFVRLRGINRIDSQAFSFYLIIEPSENPVWRDIDSLTLLANTTFNLFDIVKGADTITGSSLPSGSSLSNGKLTIGTEGGTPRFTATNTNGSRNKNITISVVQRGDIDNFSDIFRHRVEISGIDVTDDVKVFPSVSVRLDVDTLNEYLVNETTVVLRSDQTNAYQYNKRVADNFWESNSLNLGGFGEIIKVFIESLVDGDYVENLLFSGIIIEASESLAQAQVSVVGADASSALESSIRNFGILEKWDALRQGSDEATFKGIYVPEGSLLPIQLHTGEAWSDRKKLTLRKLQLPSEGAPIENEAYLMTSALETSGGFLDDAPILKFLAQHRAEDVRFLFKQLSLNQDVYQVLIDLPTRESDDPYILNRGSVPYSVERTRNTRLLTDWVGDSTNNRLLNLLSSPENHIADLLVEYDVEGDSYRNLYTFDKEVVAHRIERRNSTNYYILTSTPITQDRSALTLPRQSDKTGYTYDAIAEGSVIRIHHYNASTGTLTEHVAEDDTRPPQLGVHYHIGFENDFQIDEFEGISPHYRGAFKWYSGNLYYRYATDSGFGVARVNTSGTTSEMIDQAIGDYHNHLNFAFDINSSGTIYFVYATGDTKTSTLTIKRRTSAGTETTIFTETRGIGNFNDEGLDFGAFLGAHEVLFHANQLYILAPIQKADLGDDTKSVINPDVDIEQLTAEKTGERNVTTATNLNPTNLTLAPGDDIPLRIFFDGTVTGATQNDLTVYGGTIKSGSFSISSNRIDVTIMPDSKTRHKTIIVDLAEDAVDQTNEAWRITIDFETQRSRTKCAGMALYRCNVTNAAPTLTLLKTWDFVHQGVCNLTVHAGSVHYMEHPPVSAKFKPYNPDLDSYNEDMGYNIVPDPLGALIKVNSDDALESLGNLWYEEHPHSVAMTRPLSFDDDLHIVMGYGNPQELLRYNSLASQADNYQHLVYGHTIHYVVPTFNTDQNIYDAFVDLARKVNATFAIENDIISVRKRTQRTALTDGSTGTDTSDLGYDTEVGTFPISGYLLIDNEVIGYTGKTSTAFTGITRGVLGTGVVSHANNTEIVYVDYVIPATELSGRITTQEDNTKIYNVIRDTDNNFEVSDPDSLTAYPRNIYDLNLGLTHHEGAWQKSIFKETLETFKDPHDLLRFRIKPAFYIGGGDVVVIHHGGLVYRLQVVSVEYARGFTEIQGRMV